MGVSEVFIDADNKEAALGQAILQIVRDLQIPPLTVNTVMSRMIVSSCKAVLETAIVGMTDKNMEVPKLASKDDAKNERFAEAVAEACREAGYREVEFMMQLGYAILATCEILEEDANNLGIEVN